MSAEAIAVGELAKYGSTREVERTKRMDFTPTTKRGQFWKSIDPTVRGILVLVGSGVVLFGGWKTYKYFSDRAQEANARKELGAVNSEIKNLQQSGVKATLSQAQLTDMANQLQTAFDGYGSDVDLVNKVFTRVKNDVDMLNLRKAFGIRTISSGRGNPAPDKTGTLNEIIADELSTSDVYAINMVLAKQGIKNRI